MGVAGRAVPVARRLLIPSLLPQVTGPPPARSAPIGLTLGGSCGQQNSNVRVIGRTKEGVVRANAALPAGRECLSGDHDA